MTAQETFGRPALSGYGGPRVTLDAALHSVPALARYSVFRRTTAGRLQERGFDLERTGDSPNHYTIYLPTLSDHVLELVRDCFDPPELNPLKFPVT